MAGPEDREELAAEFVLGTLDGEERQAFAAALASDPGLRRLVADWEQRLSPLGLALAPDAPPAAVRARVMAAIGPADDATGTVVQLRRQRNIWRGLAMGAWAAAAVLASVLILRPVGLPTGGRYVAVLQSEGPGPAFVASVDLAGGTVTVRPIAASLPEGKSYELWALGGGRAQPQSLGVIAADFRIPSSRLGGSALAETVFAVSLEPAGGSPTGQPTGPVLFTGKLVATE